MSAGIVLRAHCGAKCKAGNLAYVGRIWLLFVPLGSILYFQGSSVQIIKNIDKMMDALWFHKKKKKKKA